MTRRRITGEYASTKRGCAESDGVCIGTGWYARLGLRLTNRREFLQGAVWAALPVVAGAPLPTGALAAATVFPMVLIDDRHAEARAFGRAVAARGARVHSLPDGDVTAPWRESIGPAWRHASSVVAGLTRAPVLFCLEQLGWSLGQRVVFCAEHLVSAARPVHRILRATPAGQASDEMELSLRGLLWPNHLASMVATQSALPSYPRAAPTDINMAPPLPADAQMLISWIIARA